jgi:uncharacterized repeat protein (TIGR01451 family)
MTSVETNRWVGVDGVALIAGALGILGEQPALLLVGAVAVAYVAYARGDDAPPIALDVERELDEESPEPGDDVTVTVTVRNVGDRTVPDLGLIDGVPPALEVTDGPARLGTALRPGKRASFSYTVTAVRGTHEWEPLVAVARGASASVERTERVDAETTLQCLPTLEATADLPLRGLTTQYAGLVGTDVAGAGLEFYSTREYRSGDPISRIDWNRYARAGDLSTLQFREERAANVVLLIDAREEAFVAPEPGAPNAVERSTDAAIRTFTALLDGGDRVGVAALSPEECWLPPAAGSGHRARARTLFATHPALSSTTPIARRFFPTVALRRLRRRLPGDAQVLFFSPLTDAFSSLVARRLDAHGHLVTVISPDASVGDSPGRRLARIERRNRISRLRQAGIRVVDWDEESLATELERAAARWSR